MGVLVAMAGAGVFTGDVPGQAGRVPHDVREPDDGPLLQVGRTLEGLVAEPWERAADEPSHALVRLSVGLSGWITVEAESDSFDVAVSVYDETARRMFHGDEDSGPGPAAAVSFEAAAGTRYKVRVLAQDGLGGRYRLIARAGRAEPRPAEDEELERAAFYVDAAELAEADSRLLHARACWFKAGALYTRRRLWDRASRALSRTVQLASEQGDHSTEITAGLLLARSRAASWQLADAADGLRQIVLSAQGHGLEEFALEALIMLAAVEEELGNPEDCLEALGQLRMAAEAGGRHFEQVRCDGRLAVVLQQMGDVRGALEAHRASLRALREREDWTADEEAELLWLAGRVRSARDEPAIAERFLTEALDASIRPDIRLRVLGELSLVALSQGAWAGGHEWMDQFVQLADTPEIDAGSAGVLWTRATFAARDGESASARHFYERLLERLPREATTLRVEAWVALASVLEAMGRFGDARTRLEEAADLAGRGGLARQSEVVHIALGALLARIGAPQEGAAHHRTALASAEARLDVAAIAAARAGLGRVMAQTGGAVEAERLLGAAVETWLDVGRHADALAPLESLARIAWAAGDRGALARHLARAEQSFDALGPVLVHGQDGPGPVARWAALATELSVLRLADTEAGSEDAAVVILDGFAASARWKERAVFEGVGAPLPAVDASELLPVLSSGVGPERVLVDYVEGVERVYAWVLRAGALQLVDLGDRASLLREVDAYTDGLSGHVSLADASTVARVGRALYDTLLAEVLSADDLDEGVNEDVGEEARDAELPGVVELIVVPSPGLARLPFEALVVRAPDAHPGEVPGLAELTYLVDAVRVTYAPTTRALADLMRRGSTVRRSGETTTTLSPRESGSQPRPVGTLQLPGVGRISGRRPARCRVQFPDRLVSLDGVLAMPIDAELVVLPAITDAADPIVRGLGVQSFAAAFLRAGARAVVVSRWASPTDAPDLAAAFHLARAPEGTSSSMALRAARQAVRREAGHCTVTLADGSTRSVPVAHPHAWAGLVLVGDGR